VSVRGDSAQDIRVSEETAVVPPPPPRDTTSGPSLGTRVFQNTITLLLGRGASVVLSLATSVILARYLGRENLGHYGALYAYLMLFAWLSTFGLEQILAREAAKRRSDAGHIFFTGSVVGVALALVSIAILLLLAPAFGYSGEMRLLLLIAAIDSQLLPPIRLSGIVFQVDMRQWYAVGIGLARQMLWLVAIAFLAFGKAAFFWVIVARTACGVVEAVLSLYVTLKKGFLSRPWTFSFERARLLLRYGFPVALSVVAVGIYQRIDQVMLHKMTGDKTLGPYVVAVQMAELFSALPIALMGSLFPALSQAAGQPDLFQRYLGISYRFILTVVFGVCAVLIPIAVPLVLLFYGKQFESSASLLIVLIWSEVPIFFGVALSTGLVAANLQRYLPVATIAGALVNIGLNLIVIPRWGALGASWATVVSYAVASIFMFLLFRATRGFALQGLKIALSPFLLALGITVILSILPWPIWWKFAAACVGYLAGVCLTGTVRRTEVDRFWSLIRSNFVYGR
jgi:O-antigen/teichoic acid export membrane protein